MDVRRIIAFGKSSFVVSLPKKWLDRYHLRKGDVLFMNQEGDKLIIAPEEKEEVKEERRILLNTSNKTLSRLKREIRASYVHHYDYITLEGKNLSADSNEIIKTAQDLVALEVMEHSGTRIVLKDFLNFRDLHIADYFRKLDITIRSMFADLKDVKFADYTNVVGRRSSVVRLYLFILKIFKMVMGDSRKMSNLDLGPINFLSYYSHNYAVYRVGLWMAEIAETLSIAKKTEKKSICEAIALLERYYLMVIRAIITNNVNKAYEASEKREEYLGELKEICVRGNVDHGVSSILNSICHEIHQMCHHVYG